jgi:putative DNA primase/helicase
LSKFNYNDAAEEFVRECFLYGGVRTLHFYRGDYWAYRDNFYQVIDKNDISSRLHTFIKGKHGTVTNGNWTATERALRLNSTISSEREMPSWLTGRLQRDYKWISLLNGIIDLDKLLTGEQDFTRGHSPYWFSAYCLPFGYDEAATCPEWLEKLGQWFSGDAERIALLQEWFGYCLTPETSQHKAINFYGPPRAGKGTAAGILAALLGEDNVSAVRLEDFGKRFQYVPLIDKLVNICEEATGMNSNAVKTYIAGDLLMSDRKGREHVMFRPSARLVIVSNDQLSFHDTSGATDARLMILPFDWSYVGREDRSLADRLRGELPGIFNWALEGLKRLRAQGTFTKPARSLEEAHELRIANNPAEQWMAETFERVPECEDPDTWVFSGAAYERYKAFCATCGIRPSERWTQTRFIRELRRQFNLDQSSRVRDPIEGQLRCWKNLQVREDAPAYNPQPEY